jgi:hypothetical protein
MRRRGTSPKPRSRPCPRNLRRIRLPYFRISVSRGREILRAVEHAVSQWRSIGQQLGMSTLELDQFADAFEHAERSAARSPFEEVPDDPAAQSASSISGSISAAVMGGSGVFVPAMTVVRPSSVATVTSRRGISGGRRTSEVKWGSSNQHARCVFMGSIPARSTI